MNSYTTTGQAAAWVALAAGKNLAEQREEVIDLLNRVRRLMYNAYQNLPLEIDVEEAFCVQQFSGGAECYRGITLPAYMQAAEAAWKCGQPVRLYSKWREVHTGLAANRGVILSLYAVPGGVPTELDQTGGEDTIGVIAACESDCGKKMTIRASTSGGTKAFTLTLTDKTWTTIPESVIKIQPQGVILPTDLRGGVLLRQTRGSRILSEYVPGEHVPNYQRMKLAGCTIGETIVVRANRKFLPVWYDTDIVETDNQLAWEEGARYFRYHDAGTDMAETRKAQVHMDAFMGHLMGEKSRDLGKGVADPLHFGRRPVRSRLIRRGRFMGRSF